MMDKWQTLLSELYQIPEQDADLWDHGRNFTIDGWEPWPENAQYLTYADRMALSVIEAAGRPLRLADISRAVGRSNTGMAPRLRKLWRLGLIRRPDQCGKDWEKWEFGPQTWPFRTRNGWLFRSYEDLMSITPCDSPPASHSSDGP